jgi:GTP-binding protein SAR1
MGFWDWLTGWLEWLGLRNKSGKLLLLGLDNAGKTTLLHCLKTGNFVQFDQTTSYHREDLTIEGISFAAYDLGGHIMARQSWKDYFVSVNAVVFMVDAADPSRFSEVRGQLDELLGDDLLKGIPFLILGNKIDAPTAVHESILAQGIGVLNQTGDQTNLPPGVRPLKIQMCSVRRKSGYAEGFRWLAKFI